MHSAIDARVMLMHNSRSLPQYVIGGFFLFGFCGFVEDLSH